MSQYWILVAILLPIIGGIFTPLLPFKKRNYMLLYLEVLTVVTSLIVWGLLLGGVTEAFHVVYFVRGLSISFKIALETTSLG